MISPSRTALACTSLCLTVAGNIKLRHSYSQSAAMRNRANFTAPSELRRSLDYSGQTYWFSTDIRQLPGSRAPRYWPSVLRLSAGDSITDYIDPITGVSQLRPGVRGISWYR